MDGFTECVKKFIELFPGKKVKIGTISNALLMKNFSISKLDTIFFEVLCPRCLMAHIVQLVQTALDFNALCV